MKTRTTSQVGSVLFGNQIGSAAIIFALQATVGMGLLMGAMWALMMVESGQAKSAQIRSANDQMERYGATVGSTLLQSLMIQSNTDPVDPSSVVWSAPSLEVEGINFSCNTNEYPFVNWCNPADTTKAHPACWCMNSGGTPNSGSSALASISVKACNLRTLRADQLTSAFSPNPQLPVCNDFLKVTVEYNTVVPVLKADGTPEYNKDEDGNDILTSPKKSVSVVVSTEEVH